MKNEIIALQGKVFSIGLKSMLGSSNYGWCVADMPKEVILMGISNMPVRPGIAPVIQNFYFGVVSAEEVNIKIKFVKTCLSDIGEIADCYTAEVRIVPCNSEEFVSYSENTVLAGTEPVINFEDFVSVQDPAMKYGFPCVEMSKDARPYGFPYYC